MSEKALATGSTCPPLSGNTLRLYSMRFCPYAERTRLVLAHYNIPHDVVNVNLKQKPEWFLEKNPLGLVPVLEQGGNIIYESAICDEYLDEVYGKQSLLTSEPFERARQKIIVERFNKVIAPFYSLLRKSGDLNEAINSLHKALDVFEELLTAKFFGGNTVGLVDYHVWPWFERFPLLSTLSGADVLPAARYPKLSAWVGHMEALPAVNTAKISTELHGKFIEKHLKNEIPDYDIGIA